MEGEAGTIHLDAEAVLLIHSVIFGISLDSARDRVLKPEGLASVVNRPPTYEHYQGADLALQAAVLAHGIAEGQIFVDGNKRTGLAHRVSVSRRSPQRGLSEPVTGPVRTGRPKAKRRH
jgi:hypothetical protein